MTAPLWPIGCKRGKTHRRRPLRYLTVPVDKTRPYEPADDYTRDSWQPRRSIPKGPLGW